MKFIDGEISLVVMQAIEFVSMQHDDDLWEELIKQCLNKPEMVCKGFPLFSNPMYALVVPSVNHY